MANFDEKLPDCPCRQISDVTGQLAKAKYFCVKGCPGQERYYCEEFCATEEKHNHLGKKITDLVTEYCLRWDYLKQDIQNVIQHAKKSFIPYEHIAEKLEEYFEPQVAKGLKQEYCELQYLGEQVNSVCNEGTDSTNGLSITKMIIDLKLIELIECEKYRTTIGTDLDLLRSLAMINEDKFYSLYKNAIAIASTQSKVWEELNDKSRDLLTNLKMRELEESKFEQAKQIKDLAEKVELLMSKLGSK